MHKPINTKLDRLNITGQKDPYWLYSGASGQKKEIVNDLEFVNAIGEHESISRLDVYGVDYGQLPTFETGGPTGATPYVPKQIDSDSFFGTGWLDEFFSDMQREAGKSAERDQYEMGLIGNKGIGSDNLAAQKLLPTPRSAQESTAGFKPKAGSWLSGAFTSLAGAASKLVAGATSGASNAVTDNTAQQGSAGAGTGSTGSNNTGWLIAGGVGLAAMAIIGTIIIVKSKAKK